jgi:nitrogen regulatory protein P-II 1
MKKIVAVIKPFKAGDVKESLAKVGVLGMTLSEVKGVGRQKGHTELYRGAEYAPTFLPKLQVEVVVPDDMEEKTTRAIAESAATGSIGDGKIFVSEVAEAIRIRTGEKGDMALT